MRKHTIPMGSSCPAPCPALAGPYPTRLSAGAAGWLAVPGLPAVHASRQPPLQRHLLRESLPLSLSWLLVVVVGMGGRIVGDSHGARGLAVRVCMRWASIGAVQGGHDGAWDRGLRPGAYPPEQCTPAGCTHRRAADRVFACMPNARVVAVLRGLLQTFGDSFLHGGSRPATPPRYIDPQELLSAPTVDPYVPFDRFPSSYP